GEGAVEGAECAGELRVLLAGGGEAMQAFDDMKIGLAAFAPDQAADTCVARSQPSIERRQFGLRLDDDPAPAALVEPERHVVRDRVPGADIDVGAGLLSREGERKVIVLEALRIRQVYHVLLRCCRKCRPRALT